MGWSKALVDVICFSRKGGGYVAIAQTGVSTAAL